MTIWRGAGGGGNATTDSELNELSAAAQSAASAAAAEVRGTVDDHIANVSNPHTVTKAQVGLSNVDNTSDADKPVSTATQSSIDSLRSDTDASLALKASIDSSTGVVQVPAGTTAQRTTTLGYGIRFNTTLGQWEGYNTSLTAWGTIGGGAKGGGPDQIFFEGDKTMTTDYTITSSKNALVAGPLTINSGATLTVPDGVTLTVV